MAETHLNDISKVYLDQVAEADSLAAMQARREKRLAAQRKKMGTSATGQDFGHDYGISSDERKKRQKAEFDAFVGRGKKTQKEALDPVGQEDGDVNNDGKKDSSDKYLMKRRKAIAASMKKKMKTEAKNVHGKIEVPSGDVEKLAKTAVKNVDANVNGTVDASDKKEKGMGEFVPSADGKKKLRTKIGESLSDWRTELSEVIGDTDVKKKSETPKIKEGNVDNASKIKINPEIKEAVEEIGGTLLEMVEIDEMDYILESVYDELIEEGFTEEDVEFGIEQALVQDLEEVTSPAAVASAKMRSGNGNPKRDAGAEARSRMNISSSKPSQETKKPSFKDRLKSAAKNAIIGAGRAVGSMMKKKAQAQKSVGKVGSYIDRAKKLARQGYEQGRGPVEKKTTYRGAGVGRKEKIGEDLVNEQDAAPNEKQMLAKKKQMMLKQQMIDKQRLQMQQQGKLPTGHRTEESTYPKTIDLGMGVKRTVKSAAEEKKLRDQMSAAMGPRPGSRYRGD